MRTMKGSITKPLSIFFLIAVVSIGASYMFGVVSESNDNTNVTNTSYETPYDSHVRIQTTTFNMISYFSAAFCLVFLYVLLRVVFK